MTDPSNEDRAWRIRGAYLPVTVWTGAVILEAPGVLGWAGNARVYPGGLVFDTRLLLARADPAENEARFIFGHRGEVASITTADDPRNAVTVIVKSADRRCSSIEGDLEITAGGWSSTETGPPASASAHGSWWLPFIPTENLQIDFDSDVEDFCGSVEIDATGWVEQVDQCRRLVRQE